MTRQESIFLQVWVKQLFWWQFLSRHPTLHQQTQLTIDICLPVAFYLLYFKERTFIEGNKKERADVYRSVQLLILSTWGLVFMLKLGHE